MVISPLWMMKFTTAQQTETGSLSGDIEINTSVEPGSDIEYEILQDFEDNGFEEIDLDADEENKVRKRDGDQSCMYELSLTHISSVFIIPPVMMLLDGTNVTLGEGVGFTLTVGINTLTFVMLCQGSLHLSVLANNKQINLILNAGLISACEPNSDDTSCLSNCHLPRTIFQCPPYDDCSFISHNAQLGLDVSPGIVIHTCGELIDKIDEKFVKSKKKANVVIQAHGGNGFFSIGTLGKQFRDDLFVESACYKALCAKLREKLRILVLYSCSIAGGNDGKNFLQALANCMPCC